MLLVGVVVVVAVVGYLTHSKTLTAGWIVGVFSPVRTENIFFSTLFKLSPDQNELEAH
jgi:hypothetical protein